MHKQTLGGLPLKLEINVTTKQNPPRMSTHSLEDSMLEAGTAAPTFVLPDQDNNQVSLDDFKGQWVMLWWYRKAATAG
ncbi:MAG: hypothetical protein CL450_02095 [Acidimicrobiaceae bacterium]|nr:hypothetical protein [Acidimicrobiaceae bacterium]